MANTTIIRRSVKNQKDNGASVEELLHPYTKVADPNTLMPTQEELKTIFITGNRQDLVTSGGVSKNLISQIQGDIKNGESICDAFGIVYGIPTMVSDLNVAINDYGIDLTINRDDYELESDLADDTIKVIVASNVNATQIKDSYIRASSIVGIITLEVLALALKVTFTSETTDIDLATSVRSAIDSL